MSDVEREAVDRWLSAPGGLVETSKALQLISPRVVAWAAVSALRALLVDARGDFDSSHIELGRLVADSIDEWLVDPTAERMLLVRQRTGHAESIWNDLCGDTGQPEPVLAAATNAGWSVCVPGQLFNLTPALGEAAKRMGEERVLAAVRSALAASPRWMA